MGPELHSYRRTWALSLATARAVLALGWLVFQLFLAPVDFIWFTMAIALFAASSVVAGLRPGKFEGAFGLLALFIDTVFFMVLARYALSKPSGSRRSFFLILPDCRHQHVWPARGGPGSRGVYPAIHDSLSWLRQGSAG